jgi:hypothetical protein
MKEEQFVLLNIAPGENVPLSFAEIQPLSEKGRGGLRVGAGAIFSYLDKSREECRRELSEFLWLSERSSIPVIVQLDGEQWWRARPDLWNWWDPGTAGFDEENRRNVEWFDWGPEYALKIAWRNWGTQVRVLPPPNFLSPRYREACHEEMRYFIPLILEWHKNLPEEKKDLFLGIKLGWESAIGVNSFYYPGGNGLLNLPEEDDPHLELKGEQVPDRGVVAIGYAALTTARLAGSGALKEEDLAEIVRRHLEDLCRVAAELGVPREKLFTHVGGWKEEELLYDAALNDFSCPGWSFYRHAADASKDMGMQRALRQSRAPWWGAVEWLLQGSHRWEEWHEALVRTLKIARCRYLCIYNWNSIRKEEAAQEAIQRLLTTS